MSKRYLLGLAYIPLFSNHSKMVFEDFSNWVITSHAVWCVVVCIVRKVYVITKKKHITQKYIKQKRFQYKPLWNTNYNIQLFISFNDSIKKPYAWRFATIRSCGRQSKQCGRQCGLLFRHHNEILIKQFQSILKFVYLWKTNW